MKLTHSLRVEQKKRRTPNEHSPTLSEAHAHTDKHRHSRLRSSDAIFQAAKQELCSKCFAQWLHVCLSLFDSLFVCVRVSLCVCVGLKHMLGLCRKHKQTPTQERVKASKCEQNYVTKAFTRIIITIVPLRCNSSNSSSSNRRNSFERARSTATLALSRSLVLSRALCGPLSLSLSLLEQQL